MRRNVFVQNYSEIARDDILACLAVLRKFGHKTVDGLNRIAANAGISPRRTKTIVFEDQSSVVTDEQRRHLALSIADLFDHLADDLEKRAKALQLKADAIRHRERQQLSMFVGTQWGTSSMSSLGSSNGPRRQAA